MLSQIKNYWVYSNSEAFKGNIMTGSKFQFIKLITWKTDTDYYDRNIIIMAGMELGMYGLLHEQVIGWRKKIEII